MAVGSFAAFPVSVSVILTAGRQGCHGRPLNGEESHAEAGVGQAGSELWGPSLPHTGCPTGCKGSIDQAGSRASSPH